MHNSDFHIATHTWWLLHNVDIVHMMSCPAVIVIWQDNPLETFTKGMTNYTVI